MPACVHLVYWALGLDTAPTQVQGQLRALKASLAICGVCYLHCPDAATLAWVRLLADEVLGLERLVGVLVDATKANLPPTPKRGRKKKGAVPPPLQPEALSYILMYAASSDFKLGCLPRTAAAEGRYCNRDQDPRGPWISGDLSVKTYNPECDYPITTPSGRVVYPPPGTCWRLSRAALAQAQADNRIWFGLQGNNRPRLKRFRSELKHEGMVPLSLILPESLQQESAARPRSGADSAASSSALSCALRLLYLANLEQAAAGARAHCVLLGEPQRCALLKQALDEGTVPCAPPPQVHVLSP